MKNIRILYVPASVLAYRCGQVFAADNFAAAGFDIVSLLERGDAEETDAEPTAQFDIAEPEPELEQDNGLAPDGNPAAEPQAEPAAEPERASGKGK